MASSPPRNSEASGSSRKIQLNSLVFPKPKEALSGRPVPLTGPLVDQFGRIHKNLRVSVTDRCNIRCTYCMPESVDFLPTERLLDPGQIERVVQAGVKLGLTRVRLTGGEPLLRPELGEIVQRLRGIPGLNDLSLTTNGMLLGKWAGPLMEAGLSRLTISLDTLDEDRFQLLSRRKGLGKVLEGIEEASRVGFVGIKLNAVILRGVNEEDILPLVRFAKQRQFTLRFIESMPIGAEPWDRTRMVTGEEILQKIEAEFGSMLLDPDQDPHAPSMDYLLGEDQTRIGLISAVSRPFCQRCDRLRLTADGNLRNCLFALDEMDLKPSLLSSDPEPLERIFREVVWGKWEGHEINTSRFLKPDRTMHAIGG